MSACIKQFSNNILCQGSPNPIKLPIYNPCCSTVYTVETFKEDINRLVRASEQPSR